MLSKVFRLCDLHLQDFVNILVSIVVLYRDHCWCEQQENDECGVNDLEQDSLHRLVSSSEHLKQPVYRKDPGHFPKVNVIFLDYFLVLDDVKANQKNGEKWEVENEPILEGEEVLNSILRNQEENEKVNP